MEVKWKWGRKILFEVCGSDYVGFSLFLKGHSGEVNAVAVTADGRRVVSVSSDKTLRVWDLASGSCIATLRATPLPGAARSPAPTRSSRVTIAAASISPG